MSKEKKKEVILRKSKRFRAIIGGILLVIIVAIMCILLCKKKPMVAAEPICIDAVKEYLDNSDKKGQDGQQVQKGDQVVVDYIGRLDDGTVFDTSVEVVAKACDKYNAARDYEEGLAFEVGAGQMIAGFDRGVEGMKIGQTKTIEIAAADAYGEWDENLVYEVNKSDLENPGQYEEGQILYTPYGQSVKVSKVTKDKVYLDTNHELAGKKLIFDITIKEIK